MRAVNWNPSMSQEVHDLSQIAKYNGYASEFFCMSVLSSAEEDLKL